MTDIITVDICEGMSVSRFENQVKIDGHKIFGQSAAFFFTMGCCLSTCSSREQSEKSMRRRRVFFPLQTRDKVIAVAKDWNQK